jgi:hypothetical protein
MSFFFFYITNYLNKENEGINSNGVRTASVHALQSFGIKPPGRGCLEIVWIDRFKRGHSKVSYKYLTKQKLLIISFFLSYYKFTFSSNHFICFNVLFIVISRNTISFTCKKDNRKSYRNSSTTFTKFMQRSIML